METTVEPQEGNKVKLSVEISEAEFEPAIDAAFRKIAQEVRLPGFRPGKVPRKILEQRIGKEAARQQALQDSLPEFYAKALVENDVDAIAAPELEVVSGEEQGPITFSAAVEVRPKIRVPGYQGLQVTVDSPEVSDAERDAQIDRLRNSFASLNEVDRPARAGDHVRIDIGGSIDGEPVAGLTANDYLYEVGQGAVVPELDAHLIGSKAGDAIEFDAMAPGSDTERIDFQVAVQAVNEKVLPEANDEWASSASEFTTLAELRADTVRRMAVVKKVQSHLQMRDEVVKALVELVVDDAPASLIDAEVQRRIQDLSHRLSHQGATIEQFLAASGEGQQAFLDGVRGEAETTVKADLALRSVADAEAIDADEVDVVAEIERIATRYKIKPKEARKQLERAYQMPAVQADVRKTKALAWLMEQVTVIDRDGKAIDRNHLELADDEIDEAERTAAELDPNIGGPTDEFDDDEDEDDHSGHQH